MARSNREAYGHDDETARKAQERRDESNPFQQAVADEAAQRAADIAREASGG